MTPSQQSEYVTPLFIIAKKEGTVIYLTNFQRVNKTIVRKHYPIPRIYDTIKELEGLQFSTTLDLSMGYYTIQIDIKSKEITNIVI